MPKHIKNWLNGKQVRVNPDEPETLGQLGVLHEYTTEYHWSEKLVRSILHSTGFIGSGFGQQLSQ